MNIAIRLFSVLIVSTCFGNEQFKIDFEEPDSITIANTGKNELILSGRYYNEGKLFIPTIWTAKKVNDELQPYHWDWCGTGRKTLTIEPNESFTFPYKYHRAKGHVLVELLESQYEFINEEGDDIPTPKERKAKEALQLQEEEHRVGKKLSEILKITDVAKRKRQLEELEKEMDLGKESEVYLKVKQEIQFNQILLKNGIIKQRGTNQP